MSGGHWDYSGIKLERILLSIGQDAAVRERFPLLARTLEALGPTLWQIEHDLDWDLSCEQRHRQWPRAHAGGRLEVRGRVAACAAERMFA